MALAAAVGESEMGDPLLAVVSASPLAVVSLSALLARQVAAAFIPASFCLAFAVLLMDFGKGDSALLSGSIRFPVLIPDRERVPEGIGACGLGRTKSWW